MNLLNQIDVIRQLKSHLNRSKYKNEETYIYTQNLLNLLLQSQASPKILIIGGGVANFTEVVT